jgi:hypothetical protein
LATLRASSALSRSGWVKDLTQSTDDGMYLIASLILLGGFLVIAFVPERLVNR